MWRRPASRGERRPTWARRGCPGAIQSRSITTIVSVVCLIPQRCKNIILSRIGLELVGHKAKADVANCPAGDLASRFSFFLSTNFKALNLNHFCFPVAERFFREGRGGGEERGYRLRGLRRGGKPKVFLAYSFCQKCSLWCIKNSDWTGQVLSLVRSGSLFPVPVRRELTSVFSLFDQRNFKNVTGVNATEILVIRGEIKCYKKPISFLCNGRNGSIP